MKITEYVERCQCAWMCSTKDMGSDVISLKENNDDTNKTSVRSGAISYQWSGPLEMFNTAVAIVGHEPGALA